MVGRRENRRYSHVILVGLILVFIQLVYLTNKSSLVEEKRGCSFNEPPVLHEKKIVSFCSTRAIRRGSGQKILSISLFGPVENRAFTLENSLSLLGEFLHEMQEIYSDNWILRVYHDEKILSRAIITEFEQTYRFIDFCNVTDVGLNFLPPKIWRFLPAIDETVNIMASRDLDSPLTPRERAAMDEWILSNLTFHSMRDHNQHAVPILGGMWAFRVESDRYFSNIFRSKLFNRTLISQYSLNRDQQFLADHLWPYAADKAMAHASYWCLVPDWNQHHRPFPTQRPSKNSTKFCFVGCPRPCCAERAFEYESCPIDCRPKEHRDWIYC